MIINSSASDEGVTHNRADSLHARPWARHAFFAGLILCATIAMWNVVKVLVHLSLANELYSHIAVVPVVCGALVYLRRGTVFANPCWRPAAAWPLFVLGAVLYYAGGSLGASAPGVGLALQVVSSLLVLAGAFLLCYGLEALRAVSFPVGFLLFLIPIPTGNLNAAAAFLQRGSADVSEVLFRLAGVPIWRQGFLFALPGMNIEVAEQCSGIRSCIAFCITGLVSAYLFLKSPWQRIVICLFILPIAIFKNALRIVTLSWLALHVSPTILTGPLHRSGGVPFSLVSIALLFLLVVILRKWDFLLTSRANNAGLRPTAAKHGLQAK